MQSASWKVRISSATKAWPGVVSLLSCNRSWVRTPAFFRLYGQGLGERALGLQRHLEPGACQIWEVICHRYCIFHSM